MGTDVRRNRAAAVHPRLGTAALAGAIVLGLFLPTAAGARLAADCRSAAGTTGLPRDAVSGPVLTVFTALARETGCCA